ncbi:amidase [Celerinatantimonas sp. YJH-8]|uniref:amidase n=1 Tax=Celerinatantimonas sp. YJH-8 TaxID=3228714 RepID=UPI0038BE27D7
MNDSSVYCKHGPHQGPVNSHGPLTGLRFVYKDLYDVAGFATGAGNPTWYQSHAPAALTASVLAQLFDSGSRCVGRVQTDEIAYSLNGCNAHFGTPINPITPDRLPGGSSSGSAVAVACNDADIGLGTDTGGSIRIPSMYNGLVGIRPTHGRLSTSGIIPLAPRFDTPGWMCRDARTLERVGAFLYGMDVQSCDFHDFQFIMVDALFERLSEPLFQGWQQFQQQLQKQCDLQHWSIAAQDIDALAPVFQVLQGRQAAAIHQEWHHRYPQALAPDIDQRLSWAESLTASDQGSAEQQRLQWIQRLSAMLLPNQFLLIPTAPDVAPLRKTSSSELADFRVRLMGMTAMAGLSGCPQVQMPLLNLDGIPFGVSLIGPRDSDMQLLALARLFEEIGHD